MVENYTPYYMLMLFLATGFSGIWGAIDAIRRERSPWLIGPLCWTLIGIIVWVFIRPSLRWKYLEVSEEEFQSARRRAAQ